MTMPAETQTSPVSRVAISWVCVATNDGHPLHLDHEFAQKAGFKDVVVPGHILIGWIGQYLEEWCGGPQHIVTWKIRFTAPVWPGDSFTLRGERMQEPARNGVSKVTVTATSQDGKIGAQATAELRLPA